MALSFPGRLQCAELKPREGTVCPHTRVLKLCIAAGREL